MQHLICDGALYNQGRGVIYKSLFTVLAALMNKACFKIIEVRLTTSPKMYFCLVSSLQQVGLSALTPTVFKHIMMENKNF